jgi:hypothetical protein
MKPPTTQRSLVVLLLAFLSAHVIAATCEDGAERPIPSDAATYAQRHMIMEAVEGLTPVEDTVRLWRRGANSLCFAVDSTHSNLHFCSLSGEAKRIRMNVYQYSDESCKVEVEVTSRKVSLRVADPTNTKRDLCNPVEAFGCGDNTAIQSGVFMRTR